MAGTGDYDDNHQRAVPGSARCVDIAIKGGAIAGNHARRLPDLGDGNRRRGDWPDREGVRSCGRARMVRRLLQARQCARSGGGDARTDSQGRVGCRRKGVVGIRDYEMAENVDTWTRRFSAASPRPRDANDSAWTGIDWDGSFTHGIRGLRVEAGVYPERLEDAIEAGWKTGVELPGSDGLSHVGTMKMISDGAR